MKQFYSTQLNLVASLRDRANIGSGKLLLENSRGELRTSSAHFLVQFSFRRMVLITGPSSVTSRPKVVVLLQKPLSMGLSLVGSSL